MKDTANMVVVALVLTVAAFVGLSLLAALCWACVDVWAAIL